jgi:ketosteroid isomerase-like protein
MTTRDDVQAWLDRYVDAWRSYDAAAIGSLFSDAVTYRYHPWDEPVVGRQAVVDDWLANQDRPGSWEAEYEPLIVEGDTAVTTGWTRYFADDGSVEKVYRNIWAIRFDADGRCRDFTEYFMKEPAPESQAAPEPATTSEPST